MQEVEEVIEEGTTVETNEGCDNGEREYVMQDEVDEVDEVNVVDEVDESEIEDAIESNNDARWSEIFYLGEDTSVWVGLASKCRYLCPASKTRSENPKKNRVITK